MRRAKIVCTLGPASSDLDTIGRLIDAGMDVARLNFSHGDQDGHRQRYSLVRQAASERGKTVAILADLSGPKIRLGAIRDGQAAVQPGDSVILSPEIQEGFVETIASGRIFHTGVNYPDLARDLAPGMSLFIDDGLFRFEVQAIEGASVRATVRVGGVIKSRKGVNIPAARLSVSALTAKDEQDIAFGRSLGVDYFALSFVRRAEDVRIAKELTGDIPIIAKIEKPQAIDNLDEIADLADGLMVARGDLGIEVGFEKVPLLQKKVIRVMNDRAKPVITATQMLESMVNSPRPTRAEVSDVANAILDGTDAVMLSAESAAGKYPIESVETLARVIDEVEMTASKAGLAPLRGESGHSRIENAIAHGAARAALDADLAAVAVYSETGRSVALVSAYRPPIPIAGFSRRDEVLRRMALLWGVVPLQGHWLDDLPTMITETEASLTRAGLAKRGDHVMITFGMDSAAPAPGTSNLLKLWQIQGA